MRCYQIFRLVTSLLIILSVPSLTYASSTTSASIHQPTSRFVSKMSIHHGPDEKPYKTALTFDDGPDQVFTPQILDLLKQMQVKATFFVIGKNAAKYPDIIKRIENEGHILANHSWDHANFHHLNEYQIKKEIIQTDQLLTSITGHKPLLFRAPYGNITPSLEVQLKSMEHLLIGWSVDTRDWAGPDVPTILQTVTKQIRPGGIILQHCASGPQVNLTNTVEALPLIVKKLKKEGYTFVTIPELLSTQAYKMEP